MERARVSLEALARKLGGDLASNPTASFAVALSGGPDSTALAHVFAKWCRSRSSGSSVGIGERDQPRCVIVNHNLRKESTNEARRVEQMARRLGLDPIVCSLDLRKRKSGTKVSQRLARQARLSALLSTCLERDLKVLLTGHTLNDQLETFVMRTMRASGVRGLAGIAPVSFMSFQDAGRENVKIRTVFDWQLDDSDAVTCGANEVCILRPLLDGVEKRNTIAYCEENKLEFVTDPSNTSPKYTRNVIRHHFNTLGALHMASPPSGGSSDESTAGSCVLPSDIQLVHSKALQVSRAHFSHLRRMLCDTVQKCVVSPESPSEPSIMEGIREREYRVDVSKLMSEYPRLLVEDMLLELIHAMAKEKKKRKPRMKSIAKLCDMLLKGKSCVVHNVHCYPIPKTKKKVYSFKLLP